MTWKDLHAACTHRIEIDIPRWPANALCVAIGKIVAAHGMANLRGEAETRAKESCR